MKWFKKKDNFDPSRRKFIRDAAGLAALTAVATTGVLQVVPESTIERFKRLLDGGTIVGETLYLYEPIVIDLPNTKLINCRFIAMADMPHMVKISKNAKYCVLDGCVFDLNGHAWIEAYSTKV